MLTKRIIACMDVRDGNVVKGVQFQDLRHAGDPGGLARRYNVEGIDEVVILDITATLEKRKALARTIDAVAREIFLPLTVGGGIRDEDDAAAAVDAGADKVSLNTAALRNPEMISTLELMVYPKEESLLGAASVEVPHLDRGQARRVVQIQVLDIDLPAHRSWRRGSLLQRDTPEVSHTPPVPRLEG